MNGDLVRIEGNRVLAPDRPVIPYIEGDGIGPEIWTAARRVLDAAVERSYDGTRKILWEEIVAGKKAYERGREWLPGKTVQRIRECAVAIKGPLATPVGEGIRSLNVQLRKVLRLYAGVRPIRHIRGVPSPVKEPDCVDMVVFRENLEDVYAGIEWKSGSGEARDIISYIKERTGCSIDENSGLGIKPISEINTKNLVRRALQYAVDNNRGTVTLVHKGNIMKYTEGAFREWGYELAREEFGDRVITERECWDRYSGTMPAGMVVLNDRIADDMFQQALLRPASYEVIATPNLNGDYLSDALAAQVGGVGMAPGANMGDGIAVFEAIHGTAPKYAGLNRANPGALILSGEMMLRYLGWKEAADAVRNGLEAVIGEKRVTHDLARLMEGARTLGCSEFGSAVAESIMHDNAPGFREDRDTKRGGEDFIS